MRKLETVCIRCPVGCHLVVNEKNGEVVVTGNNCPRGAEYGRQELKNPKRTITTIFKLKNNGVLSVRTKGAVEKSKYMQVLSAIKSAKEPTSFKVGDILVKNVSDTGVDVIITGINLDC